MQTPDSPVLRDIVLIGGGHSHVGVLRMFGMKPEPGVRLTLVCTDTDTPYSGMLPGYVAGHYGFDEVHIDLPRLCARTGARFIQAEVVGLDRAADGSGGRVRLKGRPDLPYDFVSINTGSTPRVDEVPGAAERAVPVKPIQGFNTRWLQLLAAVKAQDRDWHIAVVGGGAGGVELLLAMQYRLQQEWRALGRDTGRLRFSLFSAGPQLLPTHNARVRRHFERVLASRGVAVHVASEVCRVTGQGAAPALNATPTATPNTPPHPAPAACTLHTPDGRAFDVDQALWVTQAGGPAWLRDTGLPLDEQGFVKVIATLQTSTDPRVFAAGDVCSFTDRPLEKAGVFAVRMGPPLAKNLRRAARGEAPQPWRPQRRWLALISTGDRHAVASRGALGFWGDWVWRWKDHIDRRFMQRFNAYGEDSAASPMAMPVATMASPMATPMAAPGASTGLALTPEESLQAISALAMRCGGCGAKVGATVLSRALNSLRPIERDDVLVGLHAPDDAAVVRVPPGFAVVQTIDFFRAFIDDPYRFGRIAANHALGDIYAMGGQAQTATAVCTVPPGLERKVEDLLTQMMGGAVEVLNEAGCALVGGHTGEGRELALGFALNGLIREDLQGLMAKGGLRPGDALILTKPIGTGTLMAAHAQGRARGRWVEAALRSMDLSNREGARILQSHGARAATDLTGFGLLGHLVEMTRPAGVDAEIELSALPLLDGALDCVAAGIVSSLQPANVRLRRAVRNAEEVRSDPRWPLLFDPQTAGGLLAGVPGEEARDCVEALRGAGYGAAAVIGRVREQTDELEPVVVKR